MNKYDKKIGNVTVHTGTRYVGLPHRTDSDYDDYARRSEKKQKRRRKRSEKPKTDVKNKETTTLSLIGTENIQLVSENREMSISVFCPQLLRMVNKLMTGHQFTFFHHLYKALVDGLQDPRFKLTARFKIIAPAAIPRKEGEFGDFIQLAAEGYEFTVPRSFLEDCKPAIICTYLK